ncbi:18S rRNA (adenine1779-N6/adenine1780-N6)-dimethyltransferase, partial [Nematocida sp. AWRm77]
MVETLNKTFGQHLLKNPGVISMLVEKGKIRPTDTVLEIGPGTGNLTLKLLEKAKKVVAVEKDRKIAADLLKRVGHRRQKLQLVLGDAIDVAYPEFDLCISNTPYQISSPLTFKLLNYKFRACILMFQREFALRLCAVPGDSYYCRLSVSVQIRANVQHVMKVSKKSFRPPPKVESSIVRIEPKRHAPGIDLDEFDGLVKICFSRKNKTLGAIFRQAAVKNLIFNNM